MYEQSGHVTLCERIDSKREDRKITTWKVKTALGKALFFSQRRGRPSEEVIYFSSGDGNLRAVGRAPVELLTGDVPSWGYCLSLLLLSPTPAHFPSPTFLIFTRELPLSLWEKGEEEKRKRSCSFSMPSLPASQSKSIHPTLLWSAGLCLALLSWIRTTQAEPSCSSDSSQACLPLRGKHSFLSQPSSLTAFPSHSRVIKRATCPPPSPLVFSFHHSISLFG